MTKPGPKQRRPDRDTVRRIVRQEADKARLGESAVWDMRLWPNAIEARHRAMLRILNETGCSASGLAAVWGCSVTSVVSTVRKTRAPKPTPTPPPKRYDDRTLARLTWQYGEDRASRIEAGQDFKTNIDIAAWRRLGERRPDAA